MGQALVQVPLFFVCLISMMSVVIIVHELGHYLIARWNGAAIRSFSIGFGNPLFEKIDRHGTSWKVSQIPFGGFVSFVENAEAPVRDGVQPSGKVYRDLKPLQRIAVSLGGPLANFLLAIAIFSLTLLVFGKQVYTIGITGVEAGGPAERAGFVAGDVFVSANGRAVSGPETILRTILLSPNVPVAFVVDREGDFVRLVVTPEERVRDNGIGQQVQQATIGVSIAQVGIGDEIRYNPFTAVAQGVVETGDTIQANFTMLGRMITGKMSVHSMSGPVGIGDVSRRVVNSVWDQPELTSAQKFTELFWRLVTLCAAISIGLGVFNLLPFPMLDGGAVATETWHLATRRAVPSQLVDLSRLAGAALLVLLMLFITVGDVFETGIFTRAGS